MSEEDKNARALRHGRKSVARSAWKEWGRFMRESRAEKEALARQRRLMAVLEQAKKDEEEARERRAEEMRKAAEEAQRKAEEDERRKKAQELEDIRMGQQRKKAREALKLKVRLRSRLSALPPHLSRIALRHAEPGAGAAPPQG